ncbi:MAG: multidrug efflux pump protein [Thermonema sp.]|uniref:efflux RND transporter permease subunit n=1 Tax=Thermonema sp. TaxID=2231181 RepID=UPI0021DC3176|nr:efflux RND transporter permease subunit [Thermonema sp.]GIV39092.1 MAG: multidrug efflux pump protein [Thermonema sp.]
MSPFRLVFVFVVLALLSLLSLPYISVKYAPSLRKPTLYISYGLPQAPPEVVEQKITAPLENMLSNISEVEKMESVSRYNGGSITLYFNEKTDLDFKRFEVSNLIRQLYPQLPPNASYPQVYPSASEEDEKRSPLLVYSVYAPLAPAFIQKTIEEQIKRPLSSVREIERMDIYGARPLQLTVEYDAQRLLAYGLKVSDLQQHLQRFFERQFVGIYESPQQQRFYMEVLMLPQSLHDIEQSELRPGMRFGFFAKLYREEEEARRYFRINGKNAVRLLVYARPDVNTLVLAEQVRNRIERLAKRLPEGFRVVLEDDRTEKMREELQKIQYRTGLSVAILLLIILLIYRDWRYLLVLLGGVFINLSLTFALIYLLGIEVHIYSLAGLTLSFGMLLDNAVVMLDHLKTKGNTHAFLGLLGATATTMAALGLVWLLPESQRIQLIDFAWVIIVSLGLSLVVALFFTPAAYGLFLQSKAKRKHPAFRKQRQRYQRFLRYERLIAWLAAHKKAFTLGVVLMFGTPVFMLPTEIKGWDWYNRLLGNEYYLENIRPYVDKVLGGALRLFMREVYEKAAFRSLERTYLSVYARMPFGTTPQQMNAIIEKVEQYLSGVGGIDKFVTNIYSGQYARIVIYFKPEYENTGLPYMLKSQLIKQSLDWAGAGWSIHGVGEGFSNITGEQMRQMRVRMTGYHYDKLYEQAQKFAVLLQRHPRVKDLNLNERLNYGDENTEAFRLHLYTGQLAQAGLSNRELLEGIALYSLAPYAQSYVSYEGDYVPVFFREKDAARFSTYDLQKQNIQLKQNQSIRPELFSRLQFEKLNDAIYKENRQYIRIIGFEYYGSYTFGERYLQRCIEQYRKVLPPGFSIEKDDFAFYIFSQQNKRSYTVLLLLLGVVYVICAILFESFRKPFYIIVTVPLSFIGLFLIFAWGDFSFDQGGYAAFVLLGGLVVNAAIFILNEYNQLRAGNRLRRVCRAVWHKSVPVLITTFSTVMGLVPFLSEGDQEIFWFSLAIGSIGGLLFSLFGVFVALPVWMSPSRNTRT